MADQEHDRPGEPPAIRDEAADSPMWLPALGLSLLLLGVVLVLWQSANPDEANPDETAVPTASDEASETAPPEPGGDEGEPPAVDDDVPDAPR